MPNDDYIKRGDVLQIECDLCIATHCRRDHQCIKAIRLNNLPAADVEPKRKWIPVTERLPEEHEMVLCYTPVDDYMCVGFVRKYKWGGKTLLKWNIITAMRSTKILTKKVTHWMPLPEPPKGEDDAEVH